MLAVLEFIWEHWQTSFRVLFGAYSLVAATSMVGTLLLSPDEPHELYDESDENDDDLLKSPLKDDAHDFHPSLEQDYVDATIHTYAHHHKHHFLMTDQSLSSTLRRAESDLDEHLRHDDLDLSHNQDDQQEHHAHRHHHFHKTRSFYQSEQALQSGDEKAVKLMSLKDQPFFVQVQSPVFARAVLIFVINSFFANFMIASLNTELEDISQFTFVEQHTLSQQFTWLLSLGMPYAVLVGWLMDRTGLEICTLLTLILGQVSTLLMVVASFSGLHTTGYAYPIAVLGFALYSLYRQFLFPVFLAYITARLGFKYFGILSGIGFALSGVAQCFMASLAEVIHHGGQGESWWTTFHVLQIVVMAALMVVPVADHREIQRREEEMERVLGQLSEGKNPPSTASTPTTAASSSTPLWGESVREDMEYGSVSKAAKPSLD